MEIFKLENHFDDYKSALEYWPLNNELSTFVKVNLLKDINLIKSTEINFRDVYELIEKKSQMDIESNDGFNNILKALRFDLGDDNQIFLIWHFNKDVDIINAKTLKEFWDSIWYGTGDESLILYIPNRFVLLVCDWGEIGLKRLV